jgi:hypothetical protein
MYFVFFWEFPRLLKAFKLQTPGKFPEEYKLHSEHGESLKTTKSFKLLNKK